MARWARAIPTVCALMAAAVISLPVDNARADLLGGLTDVRDETVESAETVVDDTVETTAGVVDNTLGSTGTGLDEPVDDLTDAVVTTSDGLTDAVNETSDGLTDTIDDASAGPPPTEDPPSTTTTTTVPSSQDVSGASVLPTTDAGSPPDSPRIADDLGETSATTIARSSDSRSGPSPDAGFTSESLTVLSAAGGLADRPVSEPVKVGPGLDSSLYGRLLAWLTSAGSAVEALLLGPLLALEIVIRALLSAGSGLVAPISLLGAYLTSLIWQARQSRPAPPSL